MSDNITNQALEIFESLIGDRATRPHLIDAIAQELAYTYWLAYFAGTEGTKRTRGDAMISKYVEETHHSFRKRIVEILESY